MTCRDTFCSDAWKLLSRERADIMQVVNLVDVGNPGVANARLGDGPFCLADQHCGPESLAIVPVVAAHNAPSANAPSARDASGGSVRPSAADPPGGLVRYVHFLLSDHMQHIIQYMGFRNGMMHLHDPFTRASSVKANDLWGTTRSYDNDLLSHLAVAFGFRAGDEDPGRKTDVPKRAPKVWAKRALRAQPSHVSETSSDGPNA